MKQPTKRAPRKRTGRPPSGKIVEKVSLSPEVLERALRYVEGNRRHALGRLIEDGLTHRETCGAG